MKTYEANGRYDVIHLFTKISLVLICTQGLSIFRFGGFHD